MWNGHIGIREVKDGEDGPYQLRRIDGVGTTVANPPFVKRWSSDARAVWAITGEAFRLNCSHIENLAEFTHVTPNLRQFFGEEHPSVPG